MKRESISLMDFQAYLMATKKTLGIRWDTKFKSKKLVKIFNRLDKRLSRLLSEDMQAEFTKNLANEYYKFAEAANNKLKEAQ